MKATNIPTLQPVPFATNAASGNKRTIPATQPAGSPGYASYSTGFPPETMQPIAAGGTPPYGQDFNGLFFDVTNELRWAQAGGTYTYDATFSTAIGGYPAGAVLKSASTNVLWISTVDDNTTDPDSSGASGWIAFRSNSGRAALAVVAGDITPSKVQLGSSLISITGDATGLTSTLRLPLTAGASYLVNNATTGSGATLNVQGATGSGVTVAQGQAAVVFSDGTNYYTAGSSGAGVYLPINGTAVAATKLATARAFNLAGVVTAGAQSFDGTGDVTLTTTIADGALTIAKTNGLQTALNGKLGLGGGTLTGSLGINGGTFTITRGAADYNAINLTNTGGVQLQLDANGNSEGNLRTVTNHPLTFMTNNALRLTLDTSGNAIFTGAVTIGTGGSNGPGSIFSGVNWGMLFTAKQASPALGDYGFAASDGTIRCTIGASGMSVTGNLTVSGTGNFQGSDRRLKRDIAKSEARPIHRGLSLFNYTMIASGEAGRGVLAHHLQVRAPEYVGQFEVQQGRRKVKRLSVNYAGTALEVALWAANEVDRLTKVVASLQKQLKQRKG